MGMSSQLWYATYLHLLKAYFQVSPVPYGKVPSHCQLNCHSSTPLPSVGCLLFETPPGCLKLCCSYTLALLPDSLACLVRSPTGLNHTAGCVQCGKPSPQLVAMHCNLNADCSLLLLLVDSLLVVLSPGSLQDDASSGPALL